MLTLSAKGTVPVLFLPDNTVIDESIDIMQWAMGQANAPTSPHDTNIQQLILKNDNEFKPWLDKYKYADRHPEKTPTDYRKKAEEFLVYLENLLQKNQNLLTEKTTLADIAIFPFIRQFAMVDQYWFAQSDYKSVQVWLQKHLTSETFKQVMVKFPLWQPGNAPVFFPEKNTGTQ